MTGVSVLSLRHAEPRRAQMQSSHGRVPGVPNLAEDAAMQAGLCSVHPTEVGAPRPPKSRGVVWVVNEAGQSLCPECDAIPALLAGHAVLAADVELLPHAGHWERGLLDSLRRAEDHAGENEIDTLLCALEPVVRRNGQAARQLRELLRELLGEPTIEPAPVAAHTSPAERRAFFGGRR